MIRDPSDGVGRSDRIAGRIDWAGKRVWCAAFLALGLPLCLLLALLVPLGEVADESAHLLRAVALLDGQVVGHRETVTYSDGVARPALGVTVDPVWEVVSRSRALAPDKVPEPEPMPAPGRPAFLPLYTIGTYFPGFYGPAALGLGLGQALGLTPAKAALLGRLADAAAYGALGLAALALARRGRALLFGVLVLPMSLSLAASFNQDALMIATCALAAALLTGDTPRRRGLAAVLIALVVLAKPPTRPSPRCCWCRCRRVSGKPAVLAPGGTRRAGGAAGRRLDPPGHDPHRDAGAAPGLRGRPALARPAPGTVPRHRHGRAGPDPARSSRPAPHPAGAVPVRAVKRALVLAQGAIGLFGWADKPLPAFIYAAWGAGLAGLVVLCGRSVRLRRLDLALLVTAALVTAWLVAISQYLSWTPVGEARIDGPQGRYFLPLIPMLVLAIAPRPAGTGTPGLRWAFVIATAVAALDLVVVPLAAARMF